MSAAAAPPPAAGSGEACDLVLATAVDFWRGGAGHRERIAALVRHLCGKLRLLVVYLGALQTRDRRALRELPATVRLLALTDPRAGEDAKRRLFRKLLEAARPRAACRW